MQVRHSPIVSVVASLVIQTSVMAQTTQSVPCWGNNDFGQCSSPSDLVNVKQVACGWHHSYALMEDGSLRGWGGNEYGQTSTPAGLGNVVQIAVGYGHNYAVKDDGTIVGWGWNSNGQVSTPDGVNVATQMACGNQNSYALRPDGTVIGWGRSDHGENDTPANLNSVAQVACGAHHTCVVKRDGTVQGWGLNDFGQATTPAALSGVTAISCGYHFTVALKLDGSVQAWGRSDFGQLNIPTGTAIARVSCGAYFGYAIRTDGQVVGWGANGRGQVNTPTSVVGVSQIACGYEHSCALLGPPIQISSVKPISGPASGGTPITINGANFRPSASVSIAGRPATSVVVVSPSRITAVTPEGFPGEAVVAVDYGSATAFYYRPECGSDLDQDGEVTAADIAIVLLDFGPCYATATSTQPEDSTPFMLREQADSAAPLAP